MQILCHKGIHGKNERNSNKTNYHFMPKHSPDISTATSNNTSFLVHLSDELVNVTFPVTEITTLDIVLKLARPPSTSRVRELEWPKKVRCLQANNDTVEHSF